MMPMTLMLQAAGLVDLYKGLHAQIGSHSKVVHLPIAKVNDAASLSQDALRAFLEEVPSWHAPLDVVNVKGRLDNLLANVAKTLQEAKDYYEHMVHVQASDKKATTANRTAWRAALANLTPLFPAICTLKNADRGFIRNCKGTDMSSASESRAPNQEPTTGMSMILS